jgi:4-hydroxybenzoate polyprenyltransferase
MSSVPRLLAGLLRACHPEPTAAVTVATAVLAITVGRGPAGAAAAAASILASQLCVGWSNDWLDADRDATAGRGDKPVPAGQVPRRVVGIGALIAGPLTVLLGLLSGWPAAIVITVALLSALAYNWPLKNTVLSPVPYLVSFGALAAFVVLGRPDRPTPPWWLVVATAGLGGGAHFVNVLPDLADDARTGIRGLPHRLGATGSWIAAAVLLAGATTVLVFGPPGRPSGVALAIFVVSLMFLPVGWYFSRLAGSRAAFRAVLGMALADVLLLLLAGAQV